MIRRFMMVLLVGTACTSTKMHRAENVPNDRKPNTYGEDSFVDPNFDQILTVIRHAGATTVDQALAAIKAAYPDYLAHYVLMYESFSIQKATFQEPRVILDGTSGRTIVTFNSQHAEGGQGALETLAYDNEHHAHFREIAFDQETPASEVLAADEVDLARSFTGVHVSKPNIGKCIQCHTDNHPIWGNYQVWAGAYGSFDDNVYRPGRMTNGRNAFIPHGVNREFEEFDKFVANPVGRYRHLTPIPPPKPESPFDEDYTNRRNQLLLMKLARETTAELADDILRRGVDRRNLRSLLLTLKCSPTTIFDAQTYAASIREDGAASLEILAQMKRNFAPSTFSPNIGVGFNPPAEFRRYFPKVSLKDAALASQGVSPPFRDVANIRWRLKNLGIDAHRYYLNLRRTSHNLGVEDYLVPALTERLKAIDPKGGWERFERPLKSCAPAEEVG